MFGKYPVAYLHQIVTSYKFCKAKDGSIHITIKIKYRKIAKRSSQLYFSKAFLSWLICRGEGLFLGELIPLRGCEKRGCEKILNSKISFCLLNTIQNCSTTIGGSKYFNALMPGSNKKVTRT